jgi:hypothetical protein
MSNPISDPPRATKYQVSQMRYTLVLHHYLGPFIHIEANVAQGNRKIIHVFTCVSQTGQCHVSFKDSARRHSSFDKQIAASGQRLVNLLEQPVARLCVPSTPGSASGHFRALSSNILLASVSSSSLGMLTIVRYKIFGVKTFRTP